MISIQPLPFLWHLDVPRTVPSIHSQTHTAKAEQDKSMLTSGSDPFSTSIPSIMTHQTCFQTWHQQFLATRTPHSNSQSILQTLHPHHPLFQFWPTPIPITQSSECDFGTPTGIIDIVVTLLDQVSWLYSDTARLTRYDFYYQQGIEQHFSGYPWLELQDVPSIETLPLSTLCGTSDPAPESRQVPGLLKPSFCCTTLETWENPLAVVQCTRTNLVPHPFQLWISTRSLQWVHTQYFKHLMVFNPFQSTSNSNPDSNTSLCGCWDITF